MPEKSIYAPSWIAPCVAELVTQANIAVKLLQEGKLPAGALSKAFTIVVEKHAPAEPVKITPPAAPVADKEKMVVAPPIVEKVSLPPEIEKKLKDLENFPEETSKRPSLADRIRNCLAVSKMRVAGLSEQLNQSPTDIKAAIEAEGSGLRISGPGWVQIVSDE